MADRQLNMLVADTCALPGTFYSLALLQSRDVFSNMAKDNSSSSAEVSLDLPLDISYLKARLEDVIEQALPNLNHLHRPTLQIHAFFCDAQDTTKPDDFQDRAIVVGMCPRYNHARCSPSAQGTIDLRAWCSGRHISINNDTRLDETEAADRLSQGHSQVSSEARLSKNHHRSKRPRTEVQRTRAALHTANLTPPASPVLPNQPSKRQLHSSSDFVPQRKKPCNGSEPFLRPSTVDKLIIGIWEQIYSGIGLMLPEEVGSSFCA